MREELIYKQKLPSKANKETEVGFLGSVSTAAGPGPPDMLLCLGCDNQTASQNTTYTCADTPGPPVIFTITMDRIGPFSRYKSSLLLSPIKASVQKFSMT
ncbi:hypothetical protein AAFF_G00263660 [Aldrovandia affinis]|uniref:Uncharacterized protein n=1 Tax=Aldrovandia affinis TaxID=143900 RepID=A0AAD7STZ2_9TELE|nr:hypothetical protein AAFF_G00263660 [Aldrovandia affinis]